MRKMFIEIRFGEIPNTPAGILSIWWAKRLLIDKFNKILNLSTARLLRKLCLDFFDLPGDNYYNYPKCVE